MFNEIEIEIAIRRGDANNKKKKKKKQIQTSWLTDYSYFLDGFKFIEIMSYIHEYSKSKEEFILHFKRTH